MSAPIVPIAIDPQVVERYVMQLAQYGASDGTGVRRTVYSPEWEAAQRQMEAARRAASAVGAMPSGMFGDDWKGASQRAGRGDWLAH